MCRARAGGNPQLSPSGLRLRRRGDYWRVLEKLADSDFIALTTDPAGQRLFTATMRD